MDSLLGALLLFSGLDAGCLAVAERSVRRFGDRVAVTALAIALAGCGRESLERSLVLITMPGVEGAHGSGFVVRQNDGSCTVLTSGHVVDGRDAEQLRVSPNSGADLSVPVLKVERLGGVDVAELEFATEGRCPYPALRLGDAESVQLGDEVDVLGMVYSEDLGRWHNDLMSVPVRSVSCVGQGFCLGYPPVTVGGMSDGPVLLGDRVVGIHGAQVQMVNGLSWAVEINAYDAPLPGSGLVKRGVDYVPTVMSWVVRGGVIAAIGWMVKSSWGGLAGMVTGFVEAQRVATRRREEEESSVPARPLRFPKPQRSDTPEPELVSVKGVNYSRLRDLLKAGKWKEADRETAERMLEAAGRSEKGRLDKESIDNFPCEDLRTIDRLWVHFSDGKFGFSVQAKIYRELGGTREYDEEVWQRFGDRVGWRVDNSWLAYSQTTFSTSAPPAHLPLTPFFHDSLSLLGLLGLFWLGVGDLLSRRDL